jgi:hypothetical protein
VKKWNPDAILSRNMLWRFLRWIISNRKTNKLITGGIIR